jgi:hypothetical protein
VTEGAVERPIVEAEQARPVEPTSARSRAEEARRTGYRTRFAAMYLTLAVVAGGAIGSFVVLLANPDPAQPPAWSAFKPEGSATARVDQIVNKIPQSYRRADGTQLVSVSVSAPQGPVLSQDGQSVVPVGVQVIAFEEGGDFHTVETGNAVQYTLCGHGQSCTIDAARDSIDRKVLVQRQALELALYTLKYVDDVGSVTVMLPPFQTDGSTQGLQRTALFLRREDVRRELDRPLAATLAARTPRIGETADRDREALQRLSVPHIYAFNVTQRSDGAFVLVLRPELST